MSKPNKLVFFGNERLATGIASTNTLTLKALIDQGYPIAAVVSHYSKGHSRSARDLEIAAVAKQHSIPLLLPENLNEIGDKLKVFDAEAAILVAYGKIVPASIIDIFPRGIINIHPSLLPKYRGPSPIEQAILDGANETGISLMQLVAKMDSGPVFARSKIALTGGESKQDLANKLLGLGSDLLIEKLPAILDGSLTPMPQDDVKATYTKILRKEDGLVKWQEPAEHIERKVRAYYGYPKSHGLVGEHQVVITKARVAKDENDGQLVKQCQPGWLEIIELIAPSGRVMGGADFLRGYS